MRISKRTQIRLKTAFKKGNVPHNLGQRAEKKTQGPSTIPAVKYVRLEKRLHSLVSNQLLPDAAESCGDGPVRDSEFRLLRPQQATKSTVEQIAESPSNNK